MALGSDETSMSNHSAYSNLLDLPSLAQHFLAAFELGVALEPETLETSGDVVAHHFRRLTAENVMKWGELCPAEGHYSWGRADAIANFARRHGMRMTGHTLLWHQQQPDWLFFEGSAVASRATLLSRLRNHVFSMIERFADVVDNWDVVNEAISDEPNTFWRGPREHSKWFSLFGSEEFVEQAFRFALEAIDRYAPKTRLYYNDYNIEGADKRAKVIDMVRALRNKGVRIDGVGIQGHINLAWPAGAELGRTIDDLVGEGLEVKVSELDVSVYTEDDRDRNAYQEALPYGPDLDAALAQRYLEIFDVLISRAQSLTSVVFWGLDDALTWLNAFPLVRPNYPLLIDREGKPKLAFERLLDMTVRAAKVL